MTKEYDRYIEMYKELHKNSENFIGKSTAKHSKDIGLLIGETNSKIILDYGCGKGQQYTKQKIHREWGIDSVYMYDPAVPEHSRLPASRFDGVICTDVMEHVPESAVKDVLRQVIGYANKFVFLNISTRLAGKKLPNGENAHCTVKPHSWWMNQINDLMQETLPSTVFQKGLIVHLETRGQRKEAPQVSRIVL
jgi:hypothetical protein